MATLTHDTARLTAFDGLGAAPQGILARFGEWRARRREIARIEFELGTYSERHLADLGLTRGDIAAVARGQFQRG